MTPTNKPSTWALLPQVYKTIATILFVFVAGVGFGFQILQVTALPARLEADEAEIAQIQDQMDALTQFTTNNARQIEALVCMHRVDSMGGDIGECLLSR